MRGLTGLLLALAAAYGVFLLYTAVAFSWRGVGPGPAVSGVLVARERGREWMVQAGLDDVRPVELIAVGGTLFVLGSGIAFAVFGGVIAPVFAGLFAVTFPVASARSRRRRRVAQAREAWPRMIEEIRLQASTLGRSIPQAVLDVGSRGPDDLRPAFEAARREWLLSTDFPRTLSVLKSRLADATADSVCETLLIAHEVGGSDVDRRLGALIDDRILDLQGRKDAESQQAGVRFARWFVLVVPIGMAAVGLTIGDGRAAFGTVGGQIAVAIGLSLMAVCWLWAGRLMRLPEEDRVFFER